MVVEGQICGFISILAFPHAQVKNYWREHRLVILPDFQGIGLGHFLSSWLGKYLAKQGKTLISTTTNPALIKARKRDSNWAVQKIGRANQQGSKKKMKTNSRNRMTVSFKYLAK